LQQPDRHPHALLCFPPFLGLVVGQEMERGNAHWNYKMNCDHALDARGNLSAEDLLVANRVGDHEKSNATGAKAPNPRRMIDMIAKPSQPRAGG
jgi:hypothetical protein